MKKSRSSKIKKEFNGIIMGALRKRGMPYLNMDQATADIAGVLKIDISGLERGAARRTVAAVITGREMPDLAAIASIAKLKRRREKAARAAEWQKYRPISAPGIPSASTLERDIKNFYASWEWKRLSFDVKQARGRRCECCGAGAPHVRIITDHIRPLRKYWHLRLDPLNLQVLCDDCNMGKGSRDETDFRLLNAMDGASVEPELSQEQDERMLAIREQLRLN